MLQKHVPSPHSLEGFGDIKTQICFYIITTPFL